MRPLMFASIVTPAPPLPSSPLLNFTVPMETPAGLTISALSSRFSVDTAVSSRLVEAPFIPEQALTTVQRQTSAINGAVSARVFTFSSPFIDMKKSVRNVRVVGAVYDRGYFVDSRKARGHRPRLQFLLISSFKRRVSEAAA